MKFSRILGVCVLLLLLVYCPAGMAAPPEIITTDQLSEGMVGIGKTVISGSKIEEFQVKVIGVMKNSGSTGGDLILVRLYGDAIDRAGGVAQGMSGSPVFFNGKLAGAVAFGWNLSDPRICMLTPIAEMLKISEDMRIEVAKKEKRKAEKAARQRAEDNAEITKLTKEREQEKKDAAGDKGKDADSAKDPEKTKKTAKKNKNTDSKKGETGSNIDDGSVAKKDNAAADTYLPPANPKPKATPLMARGFSAQGLEILRQQLKEFDIVPYSVGEAPYGTADIKLEPGSAVSVELIRGDMSLGVLGTVTWVDGDEVLAFGHPFTKRGSVNYFLSNAWTFTTVSSINSAFKVGASGKMLGTVMQDRGSGVSGKIGTYPDVVPMLITVSDFTRGIHKSSTVQIVNDEIFSPALAEAAAVSIIDRTVDRKGEGTAVIKFTVRAADLPDGREIKRENMFYSSRNITESLTSELAAGLRLLTRNRYYPVSLTDIDVQIEITDQRNTATILSARPLAEKANPGDTIGIEVTLQPYRGDKFTKVVHFTVPKEQEEGTMPLMIRGGTSLAGLQNVVQQQQLAEAAVLLRQDTDKNKTFAEEIDEFNKRDCNHDVVVDLLYGTTDKGPASKNGKKNAGTVPSAVKEQQINEFVRGSKYKTNTPVYQIVTGETVTSVEIVNVQETIGIDG